MADGDNVKADEPSWWIWMSWLSRENGSKHFLYGCCAPVDRPPGWAKTVTSIALPEGGNMQYQQKIICAERAGSFLSALDEGNLRAAIIFETAPSIVIKNKRTVLCDDLGHGRIQTNIHHSLPSLEGLFGTNMDQSIKVVLETLKTELNEYFDGPHAARLGAFEVKHLHNWLNDSEPILVDLARFDEEGQKTTGRSILQASRAPDYAQKEHQVHLVCKSGAEIVQDRLITMAAGEQKSADIVLSESIDTYEYWWFDETGHVIAHEEANFMSEMHLNMQPVGRTVEIKDKLAERASQADQKLGEQISKVRAHSSQRSVISQRSHKEVRRFEQIMKNVTGRLFPPPSRDTFFEKGVEDEVGVIKSFSSLINAGRVKKAVLVDPFFSPEALVRLVARIESTNVELSVICSWARIDPDTGKDMEPDEGPINLLSNALRLAGDIINPKLRILNLQHKRDQAFHDRYLLLYPHEGLPEVYLLSNSINKMSGNWPFCMSLLAADVALKVQAYIEGLEQGKDISGCTSPKVSFEWPMNDV